MTQVTQQCTLEVEIWNMLTPQECLVCVAKVSVTFVEKWPIRSLVPTRVEHGG